MRALDQRITYRAHYQHDTLCEHNPLCGQNKMPKPVQSTTLTQVKLLHLCRRLASTLALCSNPSMSILVLLFYVLHHSIKLWLWTIHAASSCLYKYVCLCLTRFLCCTGLLPVLTLTGMTPALGQSPVLPKRLHLRLPQALDHAQTSPPMAHLVSSNKTGEWMCCFVTCKHVGVVRTFAFSPVLLAL